MEEEEEVGSSRKGKRDRTGQNRMNRQQEDTESKPTSNRRKRSVSVNEDMCDDDEGEVIKENGQKGYAFRGKKKTIPENVSKPRVGMSKDAKGFLESSTCHQCQRNDKGTVVRCTRCKTKRYCLSCMEKWYPKMSEDDFEKACPVCQYNCNCTSCLRMEVMAKFVMRLWISHTSR